MQEIISRSQGSWQWLCFVTVGARGTEKEGEVLQMGKRDKDRKRKEHKKRSTNEYLYRIHHTIN